LSLRTIGRQIGAGESYDLYLLRVPPRPGRSLPTAQTLPAASDSPRRPIWRVYLNGGTHGDEPAGAEAVTRFVEERRYLAWPDVAFTITPCLNPWGYVHDRREGPGGRDLNRSFRRASATTAEVGAVKRALRGQAFDLFLDCHEDVDAPGLYVFAPKALGRAIVDAVKSKGPVHPGPDVDGEIPLKESVVELDGAERRERRPAFTTWPLPYYVGRYHRRLRQELEDIEASAEGVDLPRDWRMSTATIETPTALPLEQRVAMHHAALDAALQQVTGAPPRPL
jgi:hypothetical protein